FQIRRRDHSVRRRPGLKRRQRRAHLQSAEREHTRRQKSRNKAVNRHSNTSACEPIRYAQFESSPPRIQFVKSCTGHLPELQIVLSTPPPASAQRLSWSSVKFRPLAALAFAAFVPALALCVLQYRSLVELETKTAATARERLHEVLVTSAHQFETNV